MNLHAVLFDPVYHGIAKECTSGLHINNHTDIGGSLLVENNVHVPNGDVAAVSFKKYNGTSDQFLKADGSVATLKTINGNSLEGTGNIVISGGDNGNYLPLAGGMMTGSINFTSEAYGINFSNGSQGSGAISWNSAFAGITLHSSNRLVLDSDTIWAEGNLTATSFIKDGGTSSQFLKADGSVDSNTYLIPGDKISLLGNDAGYLTSADLSGYATTSQLAGYLPLTGGTLTGDLNMANCKLNFGTSYIDEYTIPGPNGTNQGHMLNFRGVDGNGHYDFDKSVHAESFVKLNGTSNEVLMADGSTMTLAELKAALDAI